MVLLGNDGQGALLAPLPASERGVSFALDSHDPELSLLVDADLDGDLDLMTRTLEYDFDRAESRLWANDGSGFFRAGGRLRVLRILWAGDVDLDGDMDVIGAGSGYDGTSTYLYLGSNPVPGRLPTLTWDSRPGYWPHYAESGLAETDFDQNGFPDFACVVAGNVYFGPETLGFNNRFGSGGSLAPHEGLEFYYYDLAEGARLALGDLSGDSRIDALIGPLDIEIAPISEVHLNRQAGPLSYNFETVIQVVPPGLLLDLDGDGDRDVLGERIVFNRTVP